MAGYWNQLEPGSTVAIQPIPTARTGRQVFDGRDSMASNCNHSQPLRPGSGRAREGVPKVDQERRPVGAASPGDRVDGRTRLFDFALGSTLLWGRPVGAIPLASMAGHRAREARPELSIKSVDQSELSADHTAGRGGGRPIRRAIDCYPPAVDSGRLSNPITRRPASRFDTTRRPSMATAPVAIPESRSPSPGRRRWPGRLSGRT